ncbi:MAG: NAD(P)-binding protein [Pseudomonadota bacterium]
MKDREALYDLCVIGAGIAGLNSLFVARQYLPSPARVALIDRHDHAGGMWNTAYDYVRLHQPYPMFTAGNISWGLSKPKDYLASGSEVLAHLRHCLTEIEKGLLIEKFWASEVTSVEELETADGYIASVAVRPLDRDGPGWAIHAEKVIFAKGLDVPTLPPLELSSRAVVSCSPRSLSDHLETPDPVYIVGGGKTAMDTVLALGSGPFQRRIAMVVGEGTVFTNRDLLFPTGLQRYVGPHSNLNMAVDTAMQFDGTNEDDVFDLFRERYTISPSGAGERFLFGQLSRDESIAIERLTDDFVFDYLEDVVDTERGPQIVFRSGSHRLVERGSVFVNCTGHLFKNAGSGAALLSEHAKILTLTSRAAFHFLPAISAYFLTHLFFADRLHEAPFSFLDGDALVARNPKAAFLTGITHALLNTLLVLDVLPLRVFEDFGLDFDRWYPGHKRLAGLLRLKVNRRRYIAHCRQTLNRIAETYGVLCHSPVKSDLFAGTTPAS